MYPAIEITLCLDVFAQISDRFRLPLGPRFGPSTYGTNLLRLDGAGLAGGHMASESAAM